MVKKFSLIIPVYNVEEYISSCLDSIYAQTYKDYEIIIIDDLSTDGSLTKINAYNNIHTNIKIISNEIHLGPGLSRNKGIEYSSGDFVLFVDADDLLEKDLLLSISKYDSEVIIFDFIRFDNFGKVDENINRNIILDLENTDNVDLLSRAKLFSNFQVCWNKAYKRDFLNNSNIRFPSGVYEDILFTYMVLCTSERIKILSYQGYKYRKNNNSLLHSKSLNHEDITLQYDKVYQWLSTNKDNGSFLTFKSSLDEVFINHIFNLLIKQRHRLFFSSIIRIAKNTITLIDKYSISSDKSVLLKAKFIIIYILSCMRFED
ncbi:TPA: glycosyltransferase family 2 protein [Photobacterium damselae]